MDRRWIRIYGFVICIYQYSAHGKKKPRAKTGLCRLYQKCSGFDTMENQKELNGLLIIFQIIYIENIVR